MKITSAEAKKERLTCGDVKGQGGKTVDGVMAKTAQV